MIRTTAVAIAALISIAHGANAQAKTVPHDSLSNRFVGVWDGRFITDHGPTGGMQLTISRDTAWKASIEMAHSDQAIPNRVSDVKVDGKKISWSQEVMGMTCATSATVEGEAMTGDASCGQMTYKIDLRKIK